jgi:hypothetical protein
VIHFEKIVNGKKYNNIKSNAMHFLIRKNENIPVDPVGKAH